MTAMVALALKATVLICGGWVAVRLLRHRSAAERHAVWVAFFFGLLLLPMLENRTPVVATLPVLPAEVVVAPADPGGRVEAGFAERGPGPDYLAWLWAAGALLVLSYQLTGLAMLTWRYRGARPVPGARRWPRVQLLESEDCTVPMTWGFLRPRILLPVEARKWSRERRRMVLIHELTHVRRRDVWSQWLSNVGCALYWWNPVVWKAAGKMQQEREKACDDAVLRKGNTAVRYTQHLIDVARGASPAAALGMASQLEVRVRAALDHGVSRRVLTARTGLALGAVALALMVPVIGTRLAAQANGGRLSGSVLDASGAAVPDATVLVIGPDASRQEITRSGPDGRYDFPLLREGKYAIEVRARGFAIYRGAAAVEAGRSLEENLTLGVGRVQENIDVIGKKPPVQNTGQTVGTPKRIRVGGNIQATRILRMVKPSYPAELQNLGIEGTVLLEGVIGNDGKLLSLRSLNSLVHPELTKQALAAVGRWEYQPTLLNGQPVEVITTITVNFRLAE
ncbi:MAG: TonB family protein [Bryobacterales bacterium]|nr:TonB family protein [Bryobacterales bacterium]